MAKYATLTLSDLIDETLDQLYRSSERPHEVLVAAADLANASDTSFDMSAGDSATCNISDILETPNGELLLVTNKSTNTFTVNRGFAGTSTLAKAWPITSILRKNPTWERHTIRRWVEHFFKTVAMKHLPYVTNEVVNAETNKNFAELPAAVIRVLSVGYLDPFSGYWKDYDRFDDKYNMPTVVSSTGSMLNLGDLFADDLDLIVECHEQYVWSGGAVTTEVGTISCPLGAEDLPSLYAAMAMACRRPLSSIQLDKVSEFSEDEPSRRNMEVQLFKLLRGEFYQRLEEAKSGHQIPKRRPFRQRSKHGAPSIFG